MPLEARALVLFTTFFTPDQATGTEHAAETPLAAAVPSSHPQVDWHELTQVGWKGQVRSSACISFLLKQCSIDLRGSSKGISLAGLLVLASYF